MAEWTQLPRHLPLPTFRNSGRTEKGPYEPRGRTDRPSRTGERTAAAEISRDGAEGPPALPRRSLGRDSTSDRH